MIEFFLPLHFDTSVKVLSFLHHLFLALADLDTDK